MITGSIVTLWSAVIVAVLLFVVVVEMRLVRTHSRSDRRRSGPT